jgi:hypothetical protein
VPAQIFPLTHTEQDAATRDITVPGTAPATFQVLVSVFNSQGIEIFRGDTIVARGQTRHNDFREDKLTSGPTVG